MAIGDLKGEECLVIDGTAGATVTKGQTVHLEADGYWDPVAASDTGKFGVAIEGGAITESIRVCIWGRVETTAWGGAVKAGAVCMPASTGYVITTDNGAIGENVGTAMTAFDSSGVGTLFVGLVG